MGNNLQSLLKWRTDAERYPHARQGFAICRLLDELRTVSSFVPTKDFLRLYSQVNDMNLVDIPDSLVSEMKNTLETYFRDAISERYMELKNKCIEYSKYGIMIPQRAKDIINKIIDSRNNVLDQKSGLASELLLQVQITSHYDDDAQGGNVEKLTAIDIELSMDKVMTIDMAEAMVRMCFLPSHWRSLSHFPNDSSRENAPYEYIQQSLIDRFSTKEPDKQVAGISRACSLDPFTLALTTIELANIDYGQPRSELDRNYRILCDMYSGD